MALKSTVYKATLNVADMDRNYYGEHALTLALHPSETEERLMVRLAAYARYAGEAREEIKAGKGLSDAGEPDWVEEDLTGQITRWIEIGQPDDRAILKACGRSAQVVVVAYSYATDIWWRNIASKLARARNLTVLQLPSDQAQALGKACARSMQWQCSISDGQLFWNGDGNSVETEFVTLQAPQ
jgi:uncharacterized protein YaeQ